MKKEFECYYYIYRWILFSGERIESYTDEPVYIEVQEGMIYNPNENVEPSPLNDKEFAKSIEDIKKKYPNAIPHSEFNKLENIDDLIDWKAMKEEWNNGNE